MWIKLQLNFITSIQKYSSSYFPESDRIKADPDLVDRLHIACALLVKLPAVA
jgi:hypothetical protein